jgi:hypothetical protein
VSTHALRQILPETKETGADMDHKKLPTGLFKDMTSLLLACIAGAFGAIASTVAPSFVVALPEARDHLSLTYGVLVATSHRIFYY